MSATLDGRHGGPAFPMREERREPVGDNIELVTPGEWPGMSLRDYFAAKFAAAWVIALGARWKEGGFSDTDMLHESNRRGLEQADAMLAERAK